MAQLLKLKKYQAEAVEFINSRRYTLLADEMGLGKTAVAITAGASARKILIICPSFLRLNWLRELKLWRADFNDLHIQIVDNGKQKIHADIIITSFSLVSSPLIHKQLTRKKYDFLIVDESHYLKSPTAARTQHILGDGRKIRGVFAKAARVVLMTGSPMVNHAGEVFTTLVRFNPSQLKKSHLHTYMNFCLKFCYMKDNRGEITPQKVRNELLLKQLLRPFMLRRLKSEVLKELPAKQKQIIALDLNPTLKKLVKEEQGYSIGDVEKLYRSQDTQHIKDLKESEYEALATIRRRVGEAKVNLIVPHLLNDLEQVEKIVIFAWHINVIDALSLALQKYNPVTMTGSHSPKVRQKAVDDFQTDKSVRIFIGQMKSAGVGLTLTASSRVYFAESWYVPGDIEQAIDRCHRIGQKDNVLAKFFIVPDSLDERILDSALTKQKYIDKVV